MESMHDCQHDASKRICGENRIPAVQCIPKRYFKKHVERYDRGKEETKRSGSFQNGIGRKKVFADFIFLCILELRKNAKCDMINFQ